LFAFVVLIMHADLVKLEELEKKRLAFELYSTRSGADVAAPSATDWFLADDDG
jgi:hypothetical protein